MAKPPPGPAVVEALDKLVDAWHRFAGEEEIDALVRRLAELRVLERWA